MRYFSRKKKKNGKRVSTSNKTSKPTSKTNAKSISKSVAKTSSSSAAKKATLKRPTDTKIPEESIATVKVITASHNDIKGGHPHVLMGEIDDKNVSVGLTTKPKKGKNNPNKSLKIDPLGTGRESYMRRQATIDDKENYSNKRSGVMAEEDYNAAQTYAERAKKKYIEKKEQPK